MASVSITVPDALVPRVTAAMRAMFPQYSALADGAAFKAVTADYWRSIIETYEVGQARVTADAQVAAQLTQTQTDDAGIG